jgi:hypothetical protein
MLDLCFKMWIWLDMKYDKVELQLKVTTSHTSQKCVIQIFILLIHGSQDAYA